MALTVSHDLGKAKDFLREVEKYGGTVAASHDETLQLAINNPDVEGLLVSIERLPDKVKEDVKAVINANSNLGRVAQLECKAGELEGIKNLSEDQMNLLVAHMATDVAGALGHINPTQSILWNDAMHQSYTPVFEMLPKIATGEIEVQDAFEGIVRAECDVTGMDYEVPAQRAAAILAKQTRGAASAEDILEILEDIDPHNKFHKWKETLIEEECVSGYDGKTAITQGFAPDVFKRLSNGMGGAQEALKPWLQWKSEGYSKVRNSIDSALSDGKITTDQLGLNEEGHGHIIVEYDKDLEAAENKPKKFIKESHNLELKGTTIDARMPPDDIGIKLS